MRAILMLSLLLPVVASAQSQRGNRNGNNGFGMMNSSISAAPEQVVARDVPVLDGLPQAIKVGLTVYVASMVPLDSAGRLVGGADLAAQTRQAVANLASVMRAAHGVPGDVVRMTVYVRRLTPEKVDIIRRTVLDGLDHAFPPALTIVGVESFAQPDIDVSLDATGQLRSEYPDKSRNKQ